MTRTVLPFLAFLILNTTPLLPPPSQHYYPSGFRLPFEIYVTITAGPDTAESSYHTGPSAEAFDFQATNRLPFPIVSVSQGTAYTLGPALADDFGNVVMVDHGSGLWSFYAHLGSISVSNGQHVEMGQYLGDTGNSGNGRGNHLHFEIRRGVTFRGQFPSPYSGEPVAISDNPLLRYSPSPDCCARGSANGEPPSSRWGGTAFQGRWKGPDPYDSSIFTISLVQTGNQLVGNLSDTFSLNVQPPGVHGDGSGEVLSTTTAQMVFDLTRWDGRTLKYEVRLTLSNQNNTLILSNCLVNGRLDPDCPVVMQRQ